MGLHNLKSEGLTDLIEDLNGNLETAMEYGWIDEILSTYSSNPVAPFGTQIEIVSHVITALRGFLLRSAGQSYSKKAEYLLAVIEQNRDHRLAAYIEFVGADTFANVIQTYTVWKGTLWETVVRGETVVCWHPDKDFKPAATHQVKHTGYSELGRRRRRRETA